MAEYYDIYNKDRWRTPDYRLMDKFSLKGKKGFVTGINIPIDGGYSVF